MPKIRLFKREDGHFDMLIEPSKRTEGGRSRMRDVPIEQVGQAAAVLQERIWRLERRHPPDPPSPSG